MKKILLLLMFTSILTACKYGGDSLTDTTVDNSTPQVELPEHQALVEKYNLPPEPNAEVNNSTVLGIDVNNNGIRDDWERAIVFNYNDDQVEMNLHNAFAKAISDRHISLETMDIELYKSSSITAKQVISCSFYLYDESETTSEMLDFSEGTKLRKENILNASSAMSKYLDNSYWHGYPTSELETLCEKFK